MAHIEQTKKASRASGGPQYYLQGLTDNVSAVLMHRQECPIRLWTPYGVWDTGLVAVSKTVGKVGHDRIQIGRKRVRQIYHQLAYWYSLTSREIETLEFADTLDALALVISPTRVKFFGQERTRQVLRDPHPLTLTTTHQSPLLREQFRQNAAVCPRCKGWLVGQIGSLVDQHRNKEGKAVGEYDLLRASGALDRLGLDLGMFRQTQLDCPDAVFHFEGYPPYPCPVEIEERSSGFKAPHHRAHRKGRAVVLCLVHDAPDVLAEYIDVIELASVKHLLEECA